MSLSSLSTPNAPAAIGPYSQGIRAGELLFTAGQIALDPASGKFLEGDITQQTDRVMENLAAVLATAGAGWKDVVKTTVFLLDLADFSTFNDAYARHLDGARPARSTVQVAALPRGARVEIEVIARVPR
ncbi:MAG TPA: RidA family protein [Gemmatimonadaceae bacterium]|nr:RidA family protein [Gemmatimonadaceae bacterium]